LQLEVIDIKDISEKEFFLGDNNMPSVVNGDLCIKCGTCAGVCPVEAFHIAEDQYVVDPDTCIDCGVCISECPQSAITSSDEAEEKWVTANEELAKTSPSAY